PTNWQSKRLTCKPSLAGRERVHEPEHARVLQIRKFPAPKFPMAGRAHRHHLPTAAPRHSAPGRHFVLHLPFAFLHARHLSRRFATNEIAPRLHSRGFILSAARRWTNCPRRRFSSATGETTASAGRSI